jgi:hypothetical protein
MAEVAMANLVNMPTNKRYHIIVKIMGGLGNQFFQYAYARMLKELGYSVSLDIQSFYLVDNYDAKTTFRDYLLDKFQITIPPIDIYKSIYGFLLRGFKNKNPLLGKLSTLPFYFWYKNHMINCDNLTQYDSNLLNIKKNCYISGYFQSIKYFSAINDILRKELRPRKKPSGNFYYSLIRSKHAEDTIAVHIRRGDYCGSGNELPIDYYQNAIGYMINRLKDTCRGIYFFIFSDDLKYVKNNFTFPKPVVFVNEDHSLDDFEEFLAMSECRHFIIANSSFSWWAAWLSNKNDKVICAPNQWVAYPDDHRDIIPDYFVKIPY